MNIQTAAHRLNRKLKKHEAQAIIESLYNGHAADPKDLAALYKYFMPAIPKRCDPVAWVAKARSKEQVRVYLTQSYSDGKYLIATDGHRMHWIETDLPAGYYDHDGQLIDIDGTFPDWKRVIPQCDSTLDFDATTAELGIHRNSPTYIINGQHFNKAYVDDILNGETKATVSYRSDDPRGPILFDSLPHGKAVVIPIRTY